MPFDYAPPKYAQVVAEIRQRIERGDYPPGSLLPSEHQLVEEFGVSRPTIVKSLSALRQDGWIDTQQGKGSVRARPARAGRRGADPARVRRAGAARDRAGRGAGAGRGEGWRRLHVTTLLGLKKGAKAFLRQRLLSRRRRAGRAGLGVAAAGAGSGHRPGLAGPAEREHPPPPAGSQEGPVRPRGGADHLPAPDRGGSRRCSRSHADAPVLGVTVAVYDATRPPLQVVRPGAARRAARAARRLPLHLDRSATRSRIDSRLQLDKSGSYALVLDADLISQVMQSGERRSKWHCKVRSRSSSGTVFPHGAFAAGAFEPVRDFDASKDGRFVQSKDKATRAAAVGGRGDRRRPGGAGQDGAGQGRGR